MIRVVFLLICVTLLCGSALARALAPDTPACPKPTITALGPTTFCQGGSVMLSSSEATEDRFVTTFAHISDCGFADQAQTQPFWCGAEHIRVSNSGRLFAVVAQHIDVAEISKNGALISIKVITGKGTTDEYIGPYFGIEADFNDSLPHHVFSRRYHSHLEQISIGAVDLQYAAY